LRRLGATWQALFELRTAAEHDAALRARATGWAITFARQPEDAFRVVLDGADGAPRLLVLAASPRFAAYRFALMEEAVQRDPALVQARVTAASAYIRAVARTDDPTCHWSNLPLCTQAARGHILAIEKLQPDRSTAVELAARLLAVTGRANEGRTLLSNRCAEFRSAETCWQTRIALGKDENVGSDYTRALRAYYTAACTRPANCINAARFLGNTLSARKDHLGALEYYGKAVDAGDNSATIWHSIAGAARAAGQPHRAAEALKKAQGSSAGNRK
jgi:hypothetical protein